MLLVVETAPGVGSEVNQLQESPGSPLSEGARELSGPSKYGVQDAEDVFLGNTMAVERAALGSEKPQDAGSRRALWGVPKRGASPLVQTPPLENSWASSHRLHAFGKLSGRAGERRSQRFKRERIRPCLLLSRLRAS